MRRLGAALSASMLLVAGAGCSSGTTSALSSTSSTGAVAESYPPAPAGPKAGKQPVVVNAGTWEPGDGFADVRVSDVLAIDRNGCVYAAGANGAKMDVLWPAGFSGRFGDHGRLELLDASGQVLMHEGQRFISSGGSSQGTPLKCRADTHGDPGARDTWQSKAQSRCESTNW